MFCKGLRLLLILFVATVQYSPPCYAQFHFNHIATPQGAFEYAVTALYQDHRGFIWIGTGQGLFRYDGHNLQEYHHNHYDSASLADNYVHSIAEDEDGFLWIGTNNGVSKMNPFTYECVNYQHDAKNNTSINWDFDNFVFTDSQRHIWAGNSKGLSLWDGKKNKFNLIYGKGDTSYSINAFTEENSDSYWFSRRGGIVNYKPSANTFVFYPIKKNVGVISLFVDHNGAIWAGVWGCGLFRMDKETHRFTNYAWNDLSKDDKNLVNIPFAIMENTDAGGKHWLWVGTSEGLLVIDNDTFPKTLIDHDIIKHDVLNPYSIGAGNIMRFLKDKDGNIWVGTDRGVSSVIASRQHFKVKYTRALGNISAIKKIDSLIYVTGWYSEPLTIYDKKFHVIKKWDRIPPASTNPEANRVSDIIKDNNGIFWIATNFGLVKYDAKYNKFYALHNVKGDTGIISKYLITSLCEDDSGHIWAGTYNHGLVIYDPVTNYARHILAGSSSISNDLIWLFFKDKKANIWVGSNNGLTEYNITTHRFFQMPDKPHSMYNLHNVTVSDMTEDSDNTFWIATNRGLIHFNPANKEEHLYSTEEGLQDENLTAVVIDNNSNIWMSGVGGISRYNPKKNFFTNYNVRNGALAQNGSSNFYKDNNGQLWIGGNVLMTFNPADLNKIEPPLSVYLTSIIVSGNEVKDAGILSGNQPLKTTYDLSDLTFTFTAPDYCDPYGVKYEYKLDGINPTWIDAKNAPVANYANLPPDRYVFRARAINASGVASNNDVEFAFVITPPFWRTWWFITAASLVFIALLIFVVWYVLTRRLREKLLILQKEQAIQKERNRISRDMHDDLGSGLTKIAIMSEVAKQKLNQSTATAIRLDSISDSARALVDNLNEIIWALNPRNDNLDSLMAYIRVYVTKYIEPFDVSAHFLYPAKIPQIDLSEEKRRNIFLVVKESVHNIVKHSGATSIEISLEVTEQAFTIIIHDNGNGFDTATEHSGNGLKNMPQRIQSIGGSYTILSQPDKGTTTTITIK